MAERPWGMVFVGRTMTSRSSARGMVCWAARSIFLLLGSTNTFFAGVAKTALKISSVLGFMVCPPLTTTAQPSSKNRLLSPSPAATDMKPSSSVGSRRSGAGAGSGSAGAWDSLSFLCCSRILSIFTDSSCP